jgi:hypothetical protein
MYMRLKHMWIIVGLFIWATHLIAQQNACSPLIPPGGAFRVILTDGSDHTFRSAKEWFCSDDFVQYANSNKDSGGIVVPIEGIPIGGSFDTSNQSDMTSRQQFCGDSSKQFTNDEENFLLERQGDPTLVNGYLQCIKPYYQQQDLLQTSVESHTSGLFEVKIASKAYPDAQPLITEVKPIAGATAVETSAFASGNAIPLEGQGKGPLIGTYEFSGSSSEGVVLVRTTIGDKVVTAAQCPSGSAGTWKVAKDVPHPVVKNVGVFSQIFSVPQARCHPHCGSGDTITQTFSAPGKILRNIKVNCGAGVGRPECPLNPSSFTQTDDSTVVVTIVSRTVSLPYSVTADEFEQQNAVSRDTVEQGNITYRHPFSITIPNDGNPQLMITGDQGDVAINPQTLVAGSPFDWLQINGTPQVIGASTTYTMTVVAPSCMLH